MTDTTLDAGDKNEPAPPDADTPLFPPRYRPIRFIASGGQGRVWLVRDTELERDLALKVLHRCSESTAQSAAARFQREAKLTARLQHPGIVPIHDAGRLSDGRPWYTMRPVKGRSLTQVLDDLRREPHRSQWSPSRLLEAIRTVATTAGYAHSQGVVHGDLTPNNIMLGDYGEVLLIDWGLARVFIEPDSLNTQPRGGTPGFMAPESAKSTLDATADVYSLGVILRRLTAALGSSPELREHVPSASMNELESICVKATNREPAERYADGRALGEALRQWQEGAKGRLKAQERLTQARHLRDRVEAYWAQAASLRALADSELRELGLRDELTKKYRAWDYLDDAERIEGEAMRAERACRELISVARSQAPQWDEPTEAYAALLESQIRRAETLGDGRTVAALEPELRAVGSPAVVAYLNSASTITLITEPAGAHVVANRIAPRRRRLVPVESWSLGTTPLLQVSVPSGVYVLEVEHPDYEVVRYPVRVSRASEWTGCPPGSDEPAPIRLYRKGTTRADERRVPRGWFESGGDAAAVESLAQRRLWVDDFWMQAQAVTHRNYLRFVNDISRTTLLGEILSLIPRAPDSLPALEGSLYQRGPDGAWRLSTESIVGRLSIDSPVVLIDSHAAHAYAKWLSGATGKKYRLPHDQEWEKAARGVDGRHFPYGDHVDPEWSCHVHSFGEGEKPRPVNVSEFGDDVSPYGVFGLSGNTRALCANPYSHGGPRHGTRVSSEGELETGTVADLLVVRGGAWVSGPQLCRSAGRFATRPSSRALSVGFRLVRCR